MKKKQPASTFELRVVNLRSKVLKLAFSLTHNSDDAADLTQDVMLHAFKYKDRFTHDENLGGWLATMTRNLFCTQYRKSQKTTALHLTDDPTGEHPSVFEYLDRLDQPWKDPTDLQSLPDDVDAVLASLPMKKKRPFLLHVQGYKYDDIAKWCEIPVGTVKNRIHVCRELLKKELYMYAA